MNLEDFTKDTVRGLAWRILIVIVAAVALGLVIAFVL